MSTWEDREVPFSLKEKDLIIFVCGPARDHICDTNGPSVVFNNTEEMLESEARKKKDFPKGWSGGSVTCSVCRASAYETSMWRDS